MIFTVCTGGEDVRIAAVQLNAIFADVEVNMKKSEEYIRQAVASGAELVLLPEFFTSAIGFSDKMLDVAFQNKQVHNTLLYLAKEYHTIIGGSYIAFDGNNAYNLFELVFPNGDSYQHKKDIPTQFENCYYANGDENNVLYTPIGNIGVALCWEMIRTDTIKRLSGKVDIVLCGSCWWDLPNDAPKEREPLRQYNQTLALETPVRFAKLLNVPVIHANHCGNVTAWNFPSLNKLQTRQLVGAAQIIDVQGNILARRCFNENEGVVISDISWEIGNRKSAEPSTQSYWIPSLPDSYINAWETINPKGKDYYYDVALHHYRKQCET